MQALKFLVIGMGVLIIAGFAVVIIVLINRMGGPKTVAEAQLPVPAHCRIAELRPDRGRVYVRTSGGAGCEQVLMVDPEDGRLLVRLSLGGAE